MTISTSTIRGDTDTVGTTAEPAHAATAVVAEGIRRRWYHLLFDLGPVTAVEFATAAGLTHGVATAWLGQQLDAAVLRVVGRDAHGDVLVLLPGEHVTALLGDHDGPELSGARAMAVRYRDRIAPVVRALT